jgi:GntP family gluconate:H+ symporter
LPVLLILIATVADLVLPFGNAFRTTVDWLGSPVVAMLIGALFSLWSLARNKGFDKHQLSKLSEECLAPVAAILLVVGAGGGFSRVLIDTGVGSAVARQATASGISPLVLGWLVAALIRVATGSATVAITTASGLLAPMTAANPSLNRELIVVAMGAGSLMLSHVNDGGFWLVKEYLDLTVTQTLATWTVLETAISIVAFVLVLLLGLAI